MFRTYDPITKYPNAEKFCLAQETKLYFLKALTYMARGNGVKSNKKKNIFKVKRGVIENARKERALSA